MGVIDKIKSTGAVADLRAALGWRVMRRVNVGGAVHLLTGSVHRVAKRSFSSDIYYDMDEDTRIQLSGFGLSAGVMFAPIPEVNIAASFRSDKELNSNVLAYEYDSVDLPISYAGGLFIMAHPAISLSATAERHLWSSADADLAAAGGANAFDTWAVGAGLELGGSSRFPVRLGARYGLLPFSPTDEQPTEFLVSAGTALTFAGGRALIEASVERAKRDGAGAEERAWFLMFALTVTP